MRDKDLHSKVEQFIEKTVLPAFSKVGEDLYKDGVKTKFTSKPWRTAVRDDAFLHLFDVDLSHGDKEFCKISSYMSINGKNRIQFGSSIQKNYGSKKKNELLIKNIDEIDAEKLAQDILKKV